MWTCLQERPARCFALAQRMAGLHAEMHANRARPDLPAQHQRLERKINHAPELADPLRQALLAALDRLPDGDRICHGDFHPGNILLAPGRDVVIDWVDASLGNPLADVARTSVLLLGAAASHQVRHPFHRLVLRLFHAVYLGHYFRLRPGGQAEYRRWLPVVAGARLSEGIAGLEPWLLALAGRVPAK